MVETCSYRKKYKGPLTHTYVSNFNEIDQKMKKLERLQIRITPNLNLKWPTGGAIVLETR